MKGVWYGRSARKIIQSIQSRPFSRFVLSIDCGTTSSRVGLIDRDLRIHERVQKGHRSVFLNPGWNEQSTEEIYQNIKEMCVSVTEKIDSCEISAIGITNQRETCLAWDRNTGKPITTAIVWNDTRTEQLKQHFIEKQNSQSIDIQKLTGLPISTYFSALKLKWLIDNDPKLKAYPKTEDIGFGTIDSYIIFVHCYLFRD